MMNGSSLNLTPQRGTIYQPGATPQVYEQADDKALKGRYSFVFKYKQNFYSNKSHVTKYAAKRSQVKIDSQKSSTPRAVEQINRQR